MDPSGEAAEFIDALAVHGDPARAAGEKRYLKSAAVHLGVKVPLIRSVVKGRLARRPGITREELLALAVALWDGGIHEARFSAAELLKMRADLLLCGDSAVVEQFLRTSRTWALVDNLSTGVSAMLLERFPEYGDVLDRWAADRDFWLRRAALLTLLPSLRSGGGDFARFERYALPMLGEREFFIRKAIGWVLRDTSGRRPELVAGWVAANRGSMAGLTFREATRRLPDDLKKKVGATPAAR